MSHGPVRAARKTRSDWETPRWLFRMLDAEFNFSVDAAASAQNALCQTFFEDAFTADPRGVSIFCNPPYGRNLPEWIELFIRWRATNTVVALLPAATDTRWFQMVWDTADEIRFITSGRITFSLAGKPHRGNTIGSLIAVWYPHARRMTPNPAVSVLRLKGDSDPCLKSSQPSSSSSSSSAPPSLSATTSSARISFHASETKKNQGNNTLEWHDGGGTLSCTCPYGPNHSIEG